MAVKDQVQGWSLTRNLIESAWKHRAQLLTVHSSFSGERHGGWEASESSSGLHLPMKEKVFIDVYDSAGSESRGGAEGSLRVGLLQEQSQDSIPTVLSGNVS